MGTGNYSRNTFDKDTFNKLKNYVSVRLQQGVPLVDADWNEKDDIRRFEIEAFLKWFVGDGVPKGNDGFRIEPVRNLVYLTAHPSLEPARLVIEVDLDKSTAAADLGFGPQNFKVEAFSPPAQLTGKQNPQIAQNSNVLVLRVKQGSRDYLEHKLTLEAAKGAETVATKINKALEKTDLKNIIEAGCVKATDSDFLIRGGDGQGGAGICLVGGWEICSFGDVLYSKQPMLPPETTLLRPNPNLGLIAYLDCWEQPVDPDEDSELEYKGVRSCVRVKREWLVRLVPGDDPSAFLNNYERQPGHFYYPLAKLANLILAVALAQPGWKVEDLRRTGLSILDKTITIRDGNVGIGTTNPMDRLDVNGGFKLDGGFGTLLRSGVFGSSNLSESDTLGKWIKFGEIILDGIQDSAGFLVYFYPRNANSADSLQVVSVQLRNGTENFDVNSYLVSLINLTAGNSPTIQDVKIVRAAGTDLKSTMTIWFQIGSDSIHWVPILVSYYNKVTLNLTNQEHHPEISDTGPQYGINNHFGSNTVSGDWNVLGNVGIGTTMPQARLDIGSVPTTGGADKKLGDDMWFRIGDGGDSGRVWVEYGVQAAPTLVLSDLNDPPRIQFQKVGETEDPNDISEPTPSEFNPKHATWIGLAEGNSSDFAIIGGNVGIGTPDPKAKLHVNGDIIADNYLALTDKEGKTQKVLRLDSDNDVTLWNPAGGDDDDIYFGTGNLDGNHIRMTVKGQGNVGIGTTAPEAKLHINGNLKLEIGEGLEFLGEDNYFPSNYGSRDARILRMIDNNEEQEDVDGGIAIEGFTKKKRRHIMSIMGDGTVGIGTKLPTFGRLVIEHESVPMVFRETGQAIDQGGLWRMPLNDGTLRFDVNTNAVGQEFGTYLTALSMNMNGNVGIGTKSPLNRLHVEGGSAEFITNSGANPLVISRLHKDQNFEELRVGVDENVATVHYINDENWNRIDFRLENTDTADNNKGANANDNVVLSLQGDNSGGRVGIGTSQPQYSLDVRSSSGIKLGLEGNGGGRLLILNNKDDNSIYLEAFSHGQDTTLEHADLLAFTGRRAENLPRIALHADQTEIRGNLAIQGDMVIGGTLKSSNQRCSAIGKNEIKLAKNADWEDMSEMAIDVSITDNFLLIIAKVGGLQANFVKTDAKYFVHFRLVVSGSEDYKDQYPYLTATSIRLGTDQANISGYYSDFEEVSLVWMGLLDFKNANKLNIKVQWIMDNRAPDDAVFYGCAQDQHTKAKPYRHLLAIEL